MSWRSAPSCSRPCSTASTAASRALLKASSRFGAELDSLADFVNFGVAPAVPHLHLGPRRPARVFGWICVHDFRARLGAAPCALQRPMRRWTSRSGSRPTSAACRRRPGPSSCCCRSIIEHLGLSTCAARACARSSFYTLMIAFMMVSTIPTFSGKLLGERISREYVLPLFMLAWPLRRAARHLSLRHADAGHAPVPGSDPDQLRPLSAQAAGAGHATHRRRGRAHRRRHSARWREIPLGETKH